MNILNINKQVVLLTLYFSALFSGCRSEQGTLWENIEVNQKQAESLGVYIEQLQTPDRNGAYLDVHEDDIHVIKSDVLDSVFKDYVFVYVPYEQKVPKDKRHLYHIAVMLYNTIAIDDTGSKRYIFPGHGNYEQFGDFLRDECIRVKSMEDAKKIWKAFSHIHKKGWQGDFIQADENRWKLARHVNDFRAISDYEEIREEYYYLLELAEDKTVRKGRLHCEIVERRKIK